MPVKVLIDFDDLPAETVVDKQYVAKGIEFRRSSFFSAGFPFIRSYPGISHSGKQALSIRNCSGEFCPSAVYAKFTRTCQRVSLFVGSLRDPSIMEKATLFAYDAGGQVLTSSSVTVKG